MRVNRKILIGIPIILMVILMAFVFNFGYFHIGSGIRQNSSYDMGMAVSPEMAARDESKAHNILDNNLTDSSKVITNVYISLETLEFNSTIDRLSNLISKHKGYVENSNIYHNNYINNKILKRAHYTIRIPKEKVDGFINETNDIGNVVSQNTSKHDITKQYQDTESRLNVLKIKEERMLSLLEKAVKIEDIIAIENQLSDIIYQKENLTKNILDMDDQVSYSTISIEIAEVEKLTNGLTKETSFGTKVINAINDSLYFFKISVEKFVIVFIYALPYLLILGLVSVLVYKYIRKKKE